MDSFRQRALRRVTSASTQRAALEWATKRRRYRDRYGRNIYGQSVLSAGRFIEAEHPWLPCLRVLMQMPLGIRMVATLIRCADLATAGI